MPEAVCVETARHGDVALGGRKAEKDIQVLRAVREFPTLVRRGLPSGDSGTPKHVGKSSPKMKGSRKVELLRQIRYVLEQEENPTPRAAGLTLQELEARQRVAMTNSDDDPTFRRPRAVPAGIPPASHLRPMRLCTLGWCQRTGHFP